MRHTRKVLKYWFVFLILVLQQITRTYTAACEPIEIPMCKSMAYNKTRMPNLLHHSTQENAKLAIEQFEELIATNCSEYLRFFLCSMYAPICTVQFKTDAIQPCKSVCQHARDGCEPIMLEHKVPWPEYLACDDLPVYDRGVCISPEAIVTTPPEGGSCSDCKKKTKASKNSYVNNRYEYAIKAEVTSIQADRQVGMMSTTVDVKSTLKQSTVDIPEGEIHLWTNNTCVCPTIEVGEEYLIVGHEDSANGRLLLLPNSLVEKWKNKFTNAIKKWEKKLKKKLDAGSKKRRKGDKRRKGSSSRKTVTSAPVDAPTVADESRQPGGSSGNSGGSRRRKSGNSRNGGQRRRQKANTEE
ncbi:secreted frizzled-related protein 3-like [Ptychodera flava]|uniref:secreted frizzled-related protein 3-like n=1 Tax=Ptychodera flava TaxID=63121 RepID=UPI00396A26B8